MSGFKKAMKTIRIPERVEGCPVVAVDGVEGFFDEERELVTRCTSVIVPNTVEFIGSDAFRNINFLQNADLGERVKFIEDGLCVNCRTLKSVKVPGSVDAISGYDLCYALTDVEIERGVKCVDGFTYCFALKTVRIPDTVTELGRSAFLSCTALTDLYIPASVTKIGESVLNAHSDRLKIHGEKGSFAETWAKEQGITFVAE